MKVSLRHRLVFASLRSAMFLIDLLPESLAYGALGLMGQFAFHCSKRRQQYALKFLQQAYPHGRSEKELFALARRSTGNTLKVSMDMIRLNRVLKKGTFLDHVDTTCLRAAMPEPPFLVVSAHLGSWEVAAIAMAHEAREAHVVVRSFKNPLLQDFIESSRRSAGLHLHSRRGGIRGLAKALENGACATTLADQNQRLRGVFVPFFGKLASTERAAATLAVRKGYPVLVGCTVRVGRGFRFRVYTQGVIWPEVTADVATDVRRLATRINRELEKMILLYPEQYLWIHDRYRTQPKPEVPVELEPEPWQQSQSQPQEQPPPRPELVPEGG